jgi:sec-independent protein translocase protein TatA
MFGFGLPELLIVLSIVLVIFGAGKLPEIGGALGKSIRNFKKASDGKDEIEINSKK